MQPLHAIPCLWHESLRSFAHLLTVCAMESLAAQPPRPASPRFACRERINKHERVQLRSSCARKPCRAVPRQALYCSTVRGARSGSSRAPYRTFLGVAGLLADGHTWACLRPCEDHCTVRMRTERCKLDTSAGGAWFVYRMQVCLFVSLYLGTDHVWWGDMSDLQYCTGLDCAVQNTVQ